MWSLFIRFPLICFDRPGLKRGLRWSGIVKIKLLLIIVIIVVIIITVRCHFVVNFPEDII